MIKTLDSDATRNGADEEKAIGRWSRVPLGHICEINPESLSDSTAQDFRFKYLDLSCVDTGRIDVPSVHVTFGEASPRARRKVRTGDVLVGTVRPNLQAFAIVAPEHSSCIVSTGFAVLRATKADPGYVFQVLFSDPVMRQMLDSVAGSSYPAITSSTVAGLLVPLPPVAEQRAIAAILSSWDQSIRQTADLIDAKRCLKRGLMQQLLSGKLRFGKEDPGFQQVPVGQVVQKLSSAVEVDATAHYREIGIRSHGKGLFHKEPVLGAVLGEKRVYKVEPGCLTVNIVFAWEQAVAVTTAAEAGFIVSHRFPMFKPDQSRAEAKYLLHYFLSPKGHEALQLASPGGAGRNRTMSQSAFLKLTIPLPSIRFQQQFVSLVENLESEISLLDRQLASLKTQKKGMMRKLLTGEVRVKVPT